MDNPASSREPVSPNKRGRKEGNTWCRMADESVAKGLRFARSRVRDLYARLCERDDASLITWCHPTRFFAEWGYFAAFAKDAADSLTVFDMFRDIARKPAVPVSINMQ